MASFTLSSQWGSGVPEKSKARGVWEECLRVQGELKRKRGSDGEEAGGEKKAEGKRRLVTLFEANEVAKRLANGVDHGSGYYRGNALRSPVDDLMM